jgi:hypothetical protein
MLNDFEMENLRKLVFRHIKLKLLTKASISCLSHPSMSITYNLIYGVFSQLQVCEKKITL